MNKGCRPEVLTGHRYNAATGAQNILGQLETERCRPKGSKYPAGPSTQYLRTLVPKAIMVWFWDQSP